ncbi:DMT family transporter [Sulfitobacter albidus]|uniref:DMT family transporter n=1 Tax=Sulfitobacter albidus TaxID=2829501 RepID=A0A975PLI2_9RHOB|nr:DMT family transporter [Sulfitobacter albidus]QUJ75709.1 DMT family transporter [Sulfitobacter albidus]
MSANVKGALLMMGSMVAFVINDSFLRLTEGSIPLFQLIFVRGLAATALIFALATWMGALRTRLSPMDRTLVGLRALAEITTSYFFLNALFNMPLGNLNAIMQVVPLTVTLGTALVYREAVGWRRMLAIVVGLCGVLLIIRPGAEGFNQWSLYALAAVLGVTARDLITRRLSPAAPGLSVTLGTSFAVTAAAGLASLTEAWAPIGAQNAGFIAGSAVFIFAGYFLSIQVMRVGEVGFVAPFRYTGLVVAMIVGFAVFDEIPTLLTLLGAVIVIATGLFTFYRERQLSRA